MSLSQLYQSAIQQPDMVHDDGQRQLIEKLDALSEALDAPVESRFRRALRSLSPFRHHRAQPLRGLYIWGGVGRGKSWLMNLFFDHLATERKCRIHFHHFMLDIHARLDEMNKDRGRKQKDPLKQIARSLAERYRLLCIDEFIVTNITDAMILSELLHALFDNQVCLVATSNRVPDDLYLNGLQRERFLPAIELIKRYTTVFHLDSGVDHRTALLEQSDVYYHPITEQTHNRIEQRMNELAITTVEKGRTIDVLNRQLETIQCSDDIVWFEFETICTAPRAAQDYIVLAQRYATIIVNNIPQMDEYDDDRARRFIYLIDELYDRNVKLIASAEAEPDKLYRGNMLEFAFHRTASRLIEMRSHQYLCKSHKPF